VDIKKIMEEPSVKEREYLESVVGDLITELENKIRNSDKIIQGNDIYKMGYREGLHVAIKVLLNL
jgi:hypothetical protein